MNKDLIIGKHYAGSIAYGTNHENSDVDFRGLFITSESNILSPFKDIKEYVDENEEDTKFFELRNYFKLAATMNPNVIETLWIDEEDIVIDSVPYQLLRKNRELFLNQNIAHSSMGMAKNKIHSMKGHNKWINKPQPKEPPQQKDFISMIHNFTKEKIFSIKLDDYKTGYSLVPYDGNVLALIKNEKGKTFDDKGNILTKHSEQLSRKFPEFIVKFNKDSYLAAKNNHKNYWTWIKERNNKRSELEIKYGYDTKDAMHLVRVLRVGEEALKTGTFSVKRKDANELKDILNGKYSYESILDYVNKKNKEVEQLLENTKLPKEPDYQKLEKLLLKTYKLAWENPNIIFKNNRKKIKTLKNNI